MESNLSIYTVLHFNTKEIIIEPQIFTRLNISTETDEELKLKYKYVSKTFIK